MSSEVTTTSLVNIPTNEQYADDVRADQLHDLARLVAVICGVVFFTMVYRLAGGDELTRSMNLLVALVFVIVGIGLTLGLQKTGRSRQAIYVFTVTTLATAAAILYTSDLRTTEIMPFMLTAMAFWERGNVTHFRLRLPSRLWQHPALLLASFLFCRIRSLRLWVFCWHCTRRSALPMK